MFVTFEHSNVRRTVRVRSNFIEYLSGIRSIDVSSTCTDLAYNLEKRVARYIDAHSTICTHAHVSTGVSSIETWIWDATCAVYAGFKHLFNHFQV